MLDEEEEQVMYAKCFYYKNEYSVYFFATPSPSGTLAHIHSKLATWARAPWSWAASASWASAKENQVPVHRRHHRQGHQVCY